VQLTQVRGRHGALLITLIFIASACSSNAAATASPSTAPSVASPTAAAASAPASAAPSAAPSAAASPSAKWQAVLAAAKGQTVNWYMYGGDALINTFVTGYVATQAQQYGITLKEIQITDTVTAVNKVLGEKQAGDTTNGSVDMIWINGENFATMQQASALYCGWVHDLPGDQYVDWTNPTVANDFGVPVNGCESPWALAQFAMIYDSAKVPTPPTDAASLIAWIKANPGKFTYPAPPDFTGSVFVRQMLYYVNGGYQDLLGAFDQTKYNTVAPKLWTLLNGLKPNLYRQGSTYPQSIDALDQLYANGEVSFDMNYSPLSVAGQVQKGTFPQTTREFVFSDGMMGNVSYVAIPFNSPHQAAAEVVANILESADAQYQQVAADVGYPAIDLAKLPADLLAKFNSFPTPPQVAPYAVLTKNSNPELEAGWVTAVEAGWKTNVLQH
jgi:putative spermidine/putrescine transport system substrate-binding protein